MTQFLKSHFLCNLEDMTFKWRKLNGLIEHTIKSETSSQQMLRALPRKNHCFLHILLEVPSFYMGVSALFYTNGELCTGFTLTKDTTPRFLGQTWEGLGKPLRMRTWTKAMPGRRIWILNSLSSQNWFRK